MRFRTTCKNCGQMIEQFRRALGVPAGRWTHITTGEEWCPVKTKAEPYG